MLGKKKITYKEQMYRALTKMLKPGEKLQYPVYGTLFQDTASVFGFFGVAKGHLLVALLDFKQNAIGEAFRVKLDMKKVNVRKTWLGQYLLDFTLENGEAYYFRLSKKVVGIPEQKEHVEGLVAYLQEQM